MNMDLEQLSSREEEILRLVSKGSSDREIAQKLYLSINTVKWHNRQIYAKLGVSSRTQAVAVCSDLGYLKNQPAAKSSNITETAHNLPTWTSSFIGRKNDIEDIRNLVERNRLVTLTGPGGVGKTRIAVQIAAAMLIDNKFEDGLCFVDLAPVMNPDRVVTTIIDSLGLILNAGDDNLQRLKNYLANKELLLIVDNFEHLLRSSSLISDLLKAAPKVRILATSREALNISGEHIFKMYPLHLPDLSGTPKNQDFDDFESIQLFCQRAQAVNSHFATDQSTILEVAELCIKLDGLPLAIELAAALVKNFPVRIILEQINDRLDMLKDGPRDLPERHQTLRNTIEWSCNLLEEEDKHLFYRLSVFQRGGTIEAVKAICCFDLKLDVFDGLASLNSRESYLPRRRIGW